MTAGVGPNLANRPEDVRRVRSRLEALGEISARSLDPGRADPTLFAGLRRFQRKSGLPARGGFLPGDETDRLLGSTGDDRLAGGNRLFGSAGDEALGRLRGRAGPDLLLGESNRGSLFGQSGQDRFADTPPVPRRHPYLGEPQFGRLTGAPPPRRQSRFIGATELLLPDLIEAAMAEAPETAHAQPRSIDRIVGDSDFSFTAGEGLDVPPVPTQPDPPRPDPIAPPPRNPDYLGLHKDARDRSLDDPNDAFMEKVMEPAARFAAKNAPLLSEEQREAALDFIRNRRHLADANTIGADKYFHCKANCQAARRGPDGARMAEHLSNLREVYDGIFSWRNGRDTEEDQRANRAGRIAGASDPNVDCRHACAAFRPKGLDPSH